MVARYPKPASLIRSIASSFFIAPSSQFIRISLDPEFIGPQELSIFYRHNFRGYGNSNLFRSLSAYIYPRGYLDPIKPGPGNPQFLQTPKKLYPFGHAGNDAQITGICMNGGSKTLKIEFIPLGHDHNIGMLVNGQLGQFLGMVAYDNPVHMRETFRIREFLAVIDNGHLKIQHLAYNRQRQGNMSRPADH